MIQKKEAISKLKPVAAAFFVLVLICAVMAAVVFVGAESSGDVAANADTVVYIKNSEEFINTFINTTEGALSGSYVLTSDITINGSALSTSSEYWARGCNYFTFDGNNHTITLSNVSYTCNTVPTGRNVFYFGLFGLLKNSTIKNLKLTGSFSYENKSTSDIRASGVTIGKIYVGALAGRITNSNVQNVWSDVNVSCKLKGASTYAGGLIGMVSNGSECAVSNILITGEQSYARASTSTAFDYCGGLAGSVEGNVSNVSQYASIDNSILSMYFKCGGIFATTAGTTNVEYALFSNNYVKTSLYAFPQAGNLTEKRTYATIGGKNVNVSTCMSFSDNDPSMRYFTNDPYVFAAVAKNIAFDRQFYAFRLRTTGSIVAPDNLPMLCWGTWLNGLPVPTALSAFFEPISTVYNDCYYVDSSEEFSDLSLAQYFTEKYKNLDIVLTTDVVIDDDFLPFARYQGAKFDGNGHSITVPASVTVAAINAGIFSSIYSSTVTNFKFNFYGEFNSAVPASLYANGVINEALLDNYDDIKAAIRKGDSDIDFLTDYDANRANGIWNHCGLIA